MELKGKDSTVAARESIKTEAAWSHLCRAIYPISVGHAFDDPQAVVGLCRLRPRHPHQCRRRLSFPPKSFQTLVVLSKFCTQELQHDGALECDLRMAARTLALPSVHCLSAKVRLWHLGTILYTITSTLPDNQREIQLALKWSF